MTQDCFCILCKNKTCFAKVMHTKPYLRSVCGKNVCTAKSCISTFQNKAWCAQHRRSRNNICTAKGFSKPSLRGSLQQKCCNHSCAAWVLKARLWRQGQHFHFALAGNKWWRLHSRIPEMSSYNSSTFRRLQEDISWRETGGAERWLTWQLSRTINDTDRGWLVYWTPIF